MLNSAYYLTDAATIAGNASFTDYSGSTVTGHQGNGAVRITVVEIKSVSILAKQNGVWVEGQLHYKDSGAYAAKEMSELYQKENGTWIKKEA